MIIFAFEELIEKMISILLSWNLSWINLQSTFINKEFLKERA